MQPFDLIPGDVHRSSVSGVEQVAIVEEFLAQQLDLAFLKVHGTWYERHSTGIGGIDHIRLLPVFEYAGRSPVPGEALKDGRTFRSLPKRFPGRSKPI